MTVKFTNNASTTLASGINTTATSITVADASSFPSLSGADDYAYLTLQQSTGTGREIVKATALSSNTFTVVRAQDNTTARTHSSGDIVELRLTSALLTDVINAATVEGIKTNFQYTPTAGQTVFTGADNSSNTLVINDSSLINVYLNGARLVQGTDYTVDVNNNRVTLASGGTTADILDIEVFGNFTGQSGAAVAITGGAITGATIDNAVIGGSTAAAGTFTTIAGALASSVTGSTQSQGSNNTLIATTAYVDTAVSNLIDSAPNNLNTLNELAAAMNDNASFFSTVLPLSGGTMTGNIAHASDFTLDMGGEINLDADGGKIRFKDAGTEHLRFVMDNSGALQMYAAVADVDLKIQGLDGSSVIDALTLDMENAGKATFNAGGAFNDDVSVFGSDSKLFVGESGAGGTFGFLGWNDASNYLFLGNSYNSAFNTDIVISSTGKVGIGNVPTDGTLHVLTASAGTVSASTQADDLVVENNAETGITIISPDDQSARIRFTSPSTNTDVGGASIFYRQNINKMNVGTNVAGGVLALHSGAASETMRLSASSNVGIGGSYTTPKEKLHVVGAAVFDGNHATSTNAFRADEGVLIHGAGNIGFITAVSNGNNDVDLQFRALNGGSANTNQLVLDSEGPLLHGTATVPTGVLLGNQLVSSSATGSEIIAFRADTSVSVGDKTGAFLLGNSDTDGAEDHFVGMYGKVSSANGSQHLHFVAGRSGYEGDTPQMTLSSGGKLGINNTNPDAFLEVSAGTNLNLGIKQLSFNNFSNEGIGISFSRTSSDADLMAIAVVDTSKLNIASREGIIFSTGGGSTFAATSEVWRIGSDGHFKAATNGLGINFDAVEGSSATSTVLDDYEEGTFNATIIAETGSITADTSDNLCFYTKIGRLVTVSGRISVSSVSNPGGTLDIGNLPFNLASAGETSHAGAVAVNIYNAASNFGGQVVAEMRLQGTILIRGNGGTTSSVHNAAANIDSGSLIGFTATYPTT